LSSAHSVGFPFIELRKVESTNNYAMGLVHAGMAQHGTAVFAHEQTKGKGQRHKEWLSEPGKNITLSLIVYPFGLKTNQLFLLSMAVANGVHNFFSFYAGGETKTKWPNDIYWCDRKAGGILIENVIQGNNWKHAIIGIGLNINQTDFGDNSRAVSLKNITGKTYDIVSLAKEELLTFLDLSFKEMTADTDKVIRNYHEHLYKWKETVRLKKDETVIEGYLKRVNTDGVLIIETPTQEMFFKVGQVEWL
jgi:BirA family transcriptional regulator, biotin operon repressor / biotin---[acetyl-CoA-carboxylase] ligase